MSDERTGLLQPRTGLFFLSVTPLGIQIQCVSEWQGLRMWSQLSMLPRELKRTSKIQRSVTEGIESS